MWAALRIGPTHTRKLICRRGTVQSQDGIEHLLKGHIVKISEISVLVIDDDDIDCENIRRHLIHNTCDLTVYTASTLGEAIRWTRSQTASVVIVDLNLPDSKGLDTISQIRALDLDWVIIASSGDSDENLYVDALSHGADDFICKGAMTTLMLQRTILQSIERVKHAQKIKRLVKLGRLKSEAIERQSEMLRAKNRELQTLYESAQRFVNNVSHDLRTPLCVIRQYASLMAEGLVGEIDQEKQRLLRIIEGRVDGLNNMVDDMLDISRHQNGMLSANRASSDIGDIVDRVISSVIGRAELCGISLKKQITPGLPQVFCDPEKAERALTNFVTNAIKFSDEKEVYIRADRGTREGELKIDVKDLGTGIESEQLQQLFDRFEQGQNVLQSNAKGFGLGLNIAREFADLNLGRVAVQSEIGTGSTFSFTLPVDQWSHVADRYIERIDGRLGENETTHITILHASAESNQQREIDIFLNYLLRSDDLVYPISKNEFILLLRSDNQGGGAFFKRAQREAAAINRNRPQGPLESIQWSDPEVFEYPRNKTALTNRIKTAGIAKDSPTIRFDSLPVAVSRSYSS